MGSLLVTVLFALLVFVISRLVVYMEARHRDYQLGLRRDGAVPNNQVATPSTTTLRTEGQIKRRGRLSVILIYFGRLRSLQQTRRHLP